MVLHNQLEAALRSVRSEICGELTGLIQPSRQASTPTLWFGRRYFTAYDTKDRAQPRGVRHFDSEDHPGGALIDYVCTPMTFISSLAKTSEMISTQQADGPAGLDRHVHWIHRFHAAPRDCPHSTSVARQDPRPAISRKLMAVGTVHRSRPCLAWQKPAIASGGGFQRITLRHHRVDAPPPAPPRKGTSRCFSAFAEQQIVIRREHGSSGSRNTVSMLHA